MNDLFGSKPRRPRRTLMHVKDAGHDVIELECVCGYSTGWIPMELTVSEYQRGIPCPKCNEADMTEVKKAMQTLVKAMKDDPAYAYGWHCNIAMMCYDAIRDAEEDIPHEQAHLIGNEAASRFMIMCFDAETSKDFGS